MPETEVVTRAAGSLSGIDIGSTVTVSTPYWSVTGRLHEVVYDRYRPGWVNLIVGPWTGKTPTDATVSTE